MPAPQAHCGLEAGLRWHPGASAVDTSPCRRGGERGGVFSGPTARSQAAPG